MRARLGLGFVVICLFVGVVVRAQYGGGRPPSGSYSRTCSGAEMLGSVLVAECKDQNGEKIKTRLYVRDCVGDITNEFGELRCGLRRLPSGTYGRSCNACTTEGSSLQCSCRDTKQAPIKTQLDLASCGLNSSITNKDGHLQCD
jgi:CVNH domain